jgi:hypothetical protein
MASFVLTTSDSAVANDTGSHQASLVRIAGNWGLFPGSETYPGSGQYPGQMSPDAAIAPDTLASHSHVSRTVADTAAFEDANTKRTVTYPRAGADNAQSLDGASRSLLHFIRTAGDLSTSVDSAIKRQTFSRSILDAILAADVNRRVVHSPRFLFDPSTASDAVLIRQALHRAGVDASVMTDLATRSVTYPRFAKDILLWHDSIARKLTLVRAPADSALVLDSATRHLHLPVSILDTAVAADSTSQILSLLIHKHESALAVDVARAINALPRTTGDALANSDANTHTFSQPLHGFDTALAMDSLVFIIIRSMGQLIWVAGIDSLLSPYTNPTLTTSADIPVPTTLVTGEDHQILANNLTEDIAMVLGTTDMLIPLYPSSALYPFSLLYPGLIYNENVKITTVVQDDLTDIAQLLFESGGSEVINNLKTFEGKIFPRGDDPDVFSYQLTANPITVNVPRQSTVPQ